MLRTWEPVKADGSHFGCGILVDPATIVDFAEADGNLVVATKVPESGIASYYAGAGWDRSGDFKGVEDWNKYLDQAAQGQRAPVVMTIAAR